VLLSPGYLLALGGKGSLRPSGKNTWPSINFLAVRPTTTSIRRNFPFSPFVLIPTHIIPEGWAIRTVEED